MEQTLIQDKIKEIIIDVLRLGVSPAEVSVTAPFFSSGPDNPGLIEDSLAILEISSRIAEEFNLAPGDIDESHFLDIATLSAAISQKVGVVQ
jgi:acyl carrier protein